MRAALVAQQRGIGAGGGVVMEGRDIGTVVFPDADVKIYLDASAEERARRRVHDPAHQGPKDMTQVATEMAARDESDRTRAASPLAVAADAHVIDTTGVPVDEVVARVLALVREAARRLTAGRSPSLARRAGCARGSSVTLTVFR